MDDVLDIAVLVTGILERFEFGPVPRAGSILNFGQTGDPDSPHFFDQASLYVERRFKPAWFTREEVEANSVRSYTVGPDGKVP